MPEKLDAVLVGSLLYSSLLSTALGYWLMIVVSKNLSPAIVSFGLLCIPIISLSLSHFFLAEPITLHLVGSVALILAGIILRIRSEAVKT